MNNHFFKSLVPNKLQVLRKAAGPALYGARFRDGECMR